MFKELRSPGQTEQDSVWEGGTRTPAKAVCLHVSPEKLVQHWWMASERILICVEGVDDVRMRGVISLDEGRARVSIRSKGSWEKESEKSRHRSPTATLVARALLHLQKLEKL